MKLITYIQMHFIWSNYFSRQVQVLLFNCHLDYEYSYEHKGFTFFFALYFVVVVTIVIVVHINVIALTKI